MIYQIYPRSFADQNGDGIGDLVGISDHLDHLSDLGVDAIWLSPFYVSPQHDAGYDVADYRHVDPIFGTDSDFRNLIARAHRQGIRVIVDIVPNHSSSEHPWFVEALASAKGSAARSRYVFRDGRGDQGELPPNNWTSMFGGPAWTRIPDGQWYLHLFDSSQPDFNWGDDEVRAEFLDILRYWLDEGVDGFRVDVASGLIKAPGLPDAADGYAPMWDQDEVHEIYRGWRSVLAEYGDDRILIAEAWVDPPERQADYVRPDEMHQAFSPALIYTPWEPEAIAAAVRSNIVAISRVGGSPTWVLSNHDFVRHTSRLGLPDRWATQPNGIGADDVQPNRALGLRRAQAATVFMLGLPGSAYLYQGEELGLPEHTTLDDDVRQDPTWARSGNTVRGRDGCRIPLPWIADAPAFGFSTATPWLPQPEDWSALSADRQRGVPGSTFELYKAAIRLRKQLGLGTGEFEQLESGDENLLLYRNVGTLLALNMSDDEVELPYPQLRVLFTSGPGARSQSDRLAGWTAAWLQLCD
ncbi:glycoside hydrolase family 13 protein [Herbiconiux moechotypicola]|uniref:glycoside hydrolase family 13 protein n=1 Tax=Herbiconiux moechotypicola TaxID=637393 RepID=UPI0035C75015